MDLLDRVATETLCNSSVRSSAALIQINAKCPLVSNKLSVTGRGKIGEVQRIGFDQNPLDSESAFLTMNKPSRRMTMATETRLAFTFRDVDRRSRRKLLCLIALKTSE